MSEDKYKLKEEQIELLCSFFGYGDFEQADIIFLGNEEGLGNLSCYEMSILHRTECFGNDSSYYLNSQNKLAGFWEPGGLLTDTKKREFLATKGIDYIYKPAFRSRFLQFISRLVLSLEEEKENMGIHFNYNDKIELGKIRDLIKNYGLFSQRKGIKTALVDWRPLPRLNEKEKGPKWPFSGKIEEQLYLNAFRYKKTDEYHESLRVKRENILKKVFARHKKFILVSVGEKDYKKLVLENVLVDMNGNKPFFVKLNLGNTNKEMYYAKMEMENRILNIFITDFFNDQSGIRLEGLKALAYEIRDVLDKQKHKPSK